MPPLPGRGSTDRQNSAGEQRMSSDNLGPTLICMVLAVIVAASPILRRADAPVDATRHRTASLDGLRGFLALAVLLSHGTIYQTYLRTGIWLPVGGFAGMLGQGGVSMFFMLTGFLFWSRLVRARARCLSADLLPLCARGDAPGRGRTRAVRGRLDAARGNTAAADRVHHCGAVARCGQLLGGPGRLGGIVTSARVSAPAWG